MADKHAHHGGVSAAWATALQFAPNLRAAMNVVGRLAQAPRYLKYRGWVYPSDRTIRPAARRANEPFKPATSQIPATAERRPPTQSRNLPDFKFSFDYRFSSTLTNSPRLAAFD